MAVEAGVAVGKSLVDLLELDKKLKELFGIEARMKILKELSTIINTVIQDVEACSVTDAAAKNLQRKLKYLAYDMVDVVDYYDTEDSRKQRSRSYSRPVRDFFSSNNNQLVFRCRISGMIKAVMENLDSILRQKSILENLRPGINRISPSAYREIHSRNNLAVIGRETEKEIIVDMLTDDEGSSSGTMKVISIVGMGGLGKTTLARHVFNDERVKSYFGNFTMWKVVGAEFDPTKIMKSILELATGAPVNISEPELVTRELEKALSEKTFLLVLDDVWNEDQLQWRALKAGLTCGARGSKVLVTTRSQEVSSIMGSFKTLQIQQLSGDDCLSLFQQFAFGDHEETNENLMEIAGKIVEKCGGVPLAAISLGSMLHSTRDETYWFSVLNSEVWQLEDEDQKFLAVLKLSYDALPPRSKKCFAFGSLFPKNSVMKKDELIQLWIANGFVYSEGNFDAETVGNRIFDDLVLRSFFLLPPSQKCDDDGLRFSCHVTECTVHDLMHDLARSVSEGEYYNDEDYWAKDIQSRILQSDDEYCKLKGNRGEDIQKRTYHVCLGSAVVSNTSLFKKTLYLRTLSMRNCVLWKMVHLGPFILPELKFLRVLDLSHNFIEEVPTSVGNLIHLRYLNLSENKIEVLPDAVTLLQNLQYLNLTGNPLQELPKKLRNMQSLWYLHFNCEYLTRMPPGLAGLVSLRSLSCFVAENRTGSCSITELEDLKLHGEMEIKFFENFSNYSCGGIQILKNKEFNELSFNCNYLDTNVLMLDDLCPNTSLKKLKIFNYEGRQFPTWLMEPKFPNLVEVTLEYCHSCEHIPHFGNLQFLRKLVLWSMDGVKHLGAEFHGLGPIRGFPSLQEFQLHWMCNLEEWSEFDGVDELFPVLKRLEIYNCPKLKNIPRLPRIELLKLYGCDCYESLLSCVGRMTSLSHLILENMGDMTSFPSGCLRNLTSLMRLKIRSCKKLQFLPMDELQLLTMNSNLVSFPLEVGRIGALRYLCLEDLDNHTPQPEILVQILNSLHEFDIVICAKKVNLRGQLQHLHTLRQLWVYGEYHSSYSSTSGSFEAKLCICCCDELESLMTATPSTSVLEDLHICDFPNFTTLREWLQHLNSLRTLWIDECSGLRSLPRGLQHLHLNIVDDDD